MADDPRHDPHAKEREAGEHAAVQVRPDREEDRQYPEPVLAPRARVGEHEEFEKQHQICEQLRTDCPQSHSERYAREDEQEHRSMRPEAAATQMDMAEVQDKQADEHLEDDQ